MEKIKEYLKLNGFDNHGRRGIKWGKTINNSRLPVIVFVSVYQSKRWHIAVNDVEDEYLFLNAINILETEDEDKVIKLLDALIGNG
ncbi:hypothetical protein LV89_03837 [Arcicella aurantiaca]|uniref:Uncharacterized protein n=1 Tax=Arcicella aurantiaca TaxID=591202 RepID=A0A316DQM6_9BACT|nr:hypothetical protein [Arcicella aurantiaca]PWK20294.1 hypothetical protein LV89_03837 [Arcicella aurantiaca]